jgi:hypothetical protein
VDLDDVDPAALQRDLLTWGAEHDVPRAELLAALEALQERMDFGASNGILNGVDFVLLERPLLISEDHWPSLRDLLLRYVRP